MRMLGSILAFLVHRLWADQPAAGSEPLAEASQQVPVASGETSEIAAPGLGLESLANRPVHASTTDLQPAPSAVPGALGAVAQITTGPAAKSNPFWTDTGLAGFLSAPRLTRQLAGDFLDLDGVLSAERPATGQALLAAGTELSGLEDLVSHGTLSDTSKDRAAEAAALLRSIIAVTEPAPAAVTSLLVSAGVRQDGGQPELPSHRGAAFEPSPSSQPLTARVSAPRTSLPSRLELVRAGNRPLRALALPRRSAQRTIETLMLASQPVQSASLSRLPSRETSMPNTPLPSLGLPISRATAA